MLQRPIYSCAVRHRRILKPALFSESRNVAVKTSVMEGQIYGIYIETLDCLVCSAQQLSVYRKCRCVKGGGLQGTRVDIKLNKQKRVRRGKNKSNTMFTLRYNV